MSWPQYSYDTVKYKSTVSAHMRTETTTHKCDHAAPIFKGLQNPKRQDKFINLQGSSGKKPRYQIYPISLSYQQCEY